MLLNVIISAILKHSILSLSQLCKCCLVNLASLKGGTQFNSVKAHTGSSVSVRTSDHRKHDLLKGDEAGSAEVHLPCWVICSRDFSHCNHLPH